MKKLRLIFIFVVGLLLYTIVLSSFVRNIYFAKDKGERWGFLSKSVRTMAEIPSAVKTVFSQPEFYVPNSFSKDGLEIISPDSMMSSYNLLVSYKTAPFHQEFELLSMNTGETLHAWKPDNRVLYEIGQNEMNPRIQAEGSDLYFMHPLLLQDNSLIFNAQLSSLLARIDSEGEVIWTKNDRTYHHTSELDAEGFVWSCTRPFEASNYPFFPSDSKMHQSSFMDDSITRLDPENGEIIYDKPVVEILLENNLGYLITQKGQLISDPIHLNDIQPAFTSSDHWTKGDLLISCRNLNLIFLFRPSTGKIIWHKQGPWSNQHDVDFVNDHEISIYGNDILREESTLNPKVSRKNLYFSAENTHNQIYLYNFESDSIKTPYSKLLKDEKISTITSGRSEVLVNGDIFLEDTNNGRIVIGDSINKKYEYTKRVDKENVSTLFWSSILKR